MKDSIKVVKRTDKGLFKHLLNKKDIKTNKSGQMILPDGYYSAGWCYRVWEIDWNELPELEIELKNNQ